MQKKASKGNLGLFLRALKPSKLGFPESEEFISICMLRFHGHFNWCLEGYSGALFGRERSCKSRALNLSLLNHLKAMQMLWPHLKPTELEPIVLGPRHMYF